MNETDPLTVNAAAAGDTVSVAPGTYTEDVIIGKSLSLVDNDSKTTIIFDLVLFKGVEYGLYEALHDAHYY